MWKVDKHGVPFKQDAEETPVIFRKYGKRKGDHVIALFIAEAYSVSNPYLCSSYVHIGQHGAADSRLVINSTRPATEAEYAELKRELESAPYGYRLKVYARAQRHLLDARLKMIDEMRKGGTRN